MPFLDVAVLPCRAIQALFSIIVLGLTAYIIDVYRGPWGGGWTPSSVDFMLFVSIWTLLAVAYLVLVPSRYPAAAHKFAIIGVEAVTMIFWFAAWVAVAAFWGDVYRGAGAHRGPVYGSGVAAIVFGAFTWLAFVITTAVAALHVKRSSKGDTSAPPEMQMHGV